MMSWAARRGRDPYRAVQRGYGTTVVHARRGVTDGGPVPAAARAQYVRATASDVIEPAAWAAPPSRAGRDCLTVARRLTDAGRPSLVESA